MARQRRDSMDHPISFQDFPSEFDRQEPRMRKIISELEKICDETRTRKKGVSQKAKDAAIEADATAFALVPFTGGLSLVMAGVAAAAGGAAVGGAAAAGGAIAAAAAAVAAAAEAAAVVLRDKITDKDTLDKVKTLVDEFCDAAKLLKEMEEERRSMLYKLYHETDTHTLIETLRSLLSLFTSDSTLERLLEVTQQCERILEELKVVKGLLLSEKHAQSQD